MRVRAIDIDHDWLYGKGQNDYRVGTQAIVQNIDTRLYSFLGDCFFDTTAGIDWFNLLGAKDQTALNLAIAAVILNTAEVTSLVLLSINLDHVTRNLSVQYTVNTARLVTASGNFVFETPSSAPSGEEVKSKVIVVTFTSESSKAINIGVYGIDAQRCSVSVIDPANLYSDADFQVERTDASTITLVSGTNISGTFNVLVFQAGS